MHQDFDAVRFLLQDGMPKRACDICSELKISSDALESIINQINRSDGAILICVDESGDLMYQKAGGILPWNVPQAETLTANFMPTNTTDG